tara:strand:- start:250 stop:921 length:672 start_codon:yes stop_codon:yes gene_type:complete
MTYRQIINAVLRRLREDSVASDWSGDLIDATGPSDYQVLIGDFVNEVKREVEDAWDWTSLRNLVTVATVNNQTTYTITGSTQRSRMLLVQEQSVGNKLQSVPDSFVRSTQYPTGQTSGPPSFYSVNSVASGVLQAQLYPTPDAVYNINYYMVDPQDNLTTATQALICPEFPVIMGTWARAIAERGEDGGTLSDMAQMQYQQALSDAIQQDVGRHSSEVVWYGS